MSRLYLDQALQQSLSPYSFIHLVFLFSSVMSLICKSFVVTHDLVSSFIIIYLVSVVLVSLYFCFSFNLVCSNCIKLGQLFMFFLPLQHIVPVDCCNLVAG